MTNETYTLETPIRDIGVSLRLRRGLNAMGCKTLSDARVFTASQFLRLPNFGLGTLKELREMFDGAQDVGGGIA